MTARVPPGKALLYISADGLLEPLGFSQVVRVVQGLAGRGWPYRLFSLEKAADLAMEARVRELRAGLSAVGVRWQFAEYSAGGSAAAAARNEQALVSAAVTTPGVAGIHARAYHAAIGAFGAWLARGTPYLFDARSYWFDERLEEGRWFTSPIRLGVARGVEHQLFNRAAGVVTLTELQAEDVRCGRFGRRSLESVRCITTCADFDDFFRRPPEACTRVPAELRASLDGKLVLGIVGSLNRSYLVDETLQLVAKVLAREPRSHLLVLSSQQGEYRTRLEALRVSPERFSIARAHHDAMPEWLSLMHWGMLLLNPSSPAKRASMPTKLAEFLACGVRPVQFGCNAEVSEWVARTGSGVVLEAVAAEDLERAAERIVSVGRDSDGLERARALAAPHFSLSSGLDQYERVLLSTFGELRASRRPPSP